MRYERDAENFIVNKLVSDKSDFYKGESDVDKVCIVAGTVMAADGAVTFK